MKRSEVKKIKENIESHFKDLTFNEEKHKYYVKGVPITKSVSGVIKFFYKPFDAKKKSKEMALRDGTCAQTLRNQWKVISDEACARGTRVHLFGEDYPFNRTLKPSCIQEEACKKFWDSLPPHIVPVTMEIRMYHKVFLFAGTADILLYNTQTGKFQICDYKTNKDLFKNFRGQKMTGLFKSFLDCPYNHYQLQLSFYQILLEQVGVEVSHRKIVWLDIETGNYSLYDTVDLTKELNGYLETALL